MWFTSNPFLLFAFLVCGGLGYGGVEVSASLDAGKKDFLKELIIPLKKKLPDCFGVIQCCHKIIL